MERYRNKPHHNKVLPSTDIEYHHGSIVTTKHLLEEEERQLSSSGVRSRSNNATNDNVHDLAEDVLQILPRDLSSARILHIVCEAHGGVAQVADGERVHHVEAHGTVQLALHHDRVEVAKPEQYALCLAIRLRGSSTENET